MHSLYYVVIPKKGIKNSKEAKQRASQTLMDNNFSGSEGYFGGGKADWFVVGGRWSGELTKLLLDRKKLTAVKRKLGEDHWWTGGKEKITREDRRKEYKRVFDKYFPDFKGELPAWRDDYNSDGYKDDAKLVDEKLYQAIKKDKSQSLVEVFIEDDGETTISDLKKEDLIGNWIVVIDYHY